MSHLWVLERHAKMNDMNDEPAWASKPLNSQTKRVLVSTILSFNKRLERNEENDFYCSTMTLISFF